MSGIVQFCRICFRNNNLLRKLHEIDIDGVKLFDKLKSCVPEILYSNELEKYELICIECCQLLKTAYMFKELCIRSNILLHGCLIRGKTGFEITECLSNNVLEQNSSMKDPTTSTSSHNETYFSDSDNNSSDNIKNDSSDNSIQNNNEIDLKSSQNNDKSRICYVCNLSFTERQQFEEHISIHKKTNTCYHCGRSFTRKTYLKKHLFIHTGIRPFICYTCNMTFNRKNTLETHMLIHSGLRNHKCHICGKCFRLKCALDRHLLIHSNQKAHKCLVCGKGFGRKDHLEKHIRVHRN